MFTIMFRKFDENGYFKCEKHGVKKYTKRAAMKHLEDNGFNPWGRTDKKLHDVYTNDNGTMAYIL